MEGLVEKERFDLAVVDYGLLDVVDMLTQSAAGRETLIVCTGLDRGPRERVKAIGAGADAFLDKPFSARLFQEVLRKIMTSEAGRRARVVPFPVVHAGEAGSQAAHSFGRRHPWGEGA
jgi:DNA-binding response OmpR family regulator